MLLEDPPIASREAAVFLGAAGGFLLGIAYLIPQLIDPGSGNFMDPEIQKVSLSMRIKFLSAIIVALPTGLTFDFVWERIMGTAKKKGAKRIKEMLNAN